MEKQFDVSKTEENLRPSIESEERPLASGIYHGFLLKGKVVLKLIDNMRKGESTEIVSCPLARLFP